MVLAQSIPRAYLRQRLRMFLSPGHKRTRKELQAGDEDGSCSDRQRSRASSAHGSPVERHRVSEEAAAGATAALAALHAALKPLPLPTGIGQPALALAAFRPVSVQGVGALASPTPAEKSDIASMSPMSSWRVSSRLLLHRAVPALPTRAAASDSGACAHALVALVATVVVDAATRFVLCVRLRPLPAFATLALAAHLGVGTDIADPGAVDSTWVASCMRAFASAALEHRLCGGVAAGGCVMLFDAEAANAAAAARMQATPTAFAEAPDVRATAFLRSALTATQAAALTDAHAAVAALYRSTGSLAGAAPRLPTGPRAVSVEGDGAAPPATWLAGFWTQLGARVGAAACAAADALARERYAAAVQFAARASSDIAARRMRLPALGRQLALHAQGAASAGGIDESDSRELAQLMRDSGEPPTHRSISVASHLRQISTSDVLEPLFGLRLASPHQSVHGFFSPTAGASAVPPPVRMRAASGGMAVDGGGSEPPPVTLNVAATETQRPPLILERDDDDEAEDAADVVAADARAFTEAFALLQPALDDAAASWNVSPFAARVSGGSIDADTCPRILLLQWLQRAAHESR